MQSWIVYAVGSAFFASLVALFGKIGISHIDSTLATTVRSIIMALFLIVVVLYFGKFENIKTLDSKAMTFIVLSGVAGALSWLLYFVALKRGPISGVVALDRTSVVFALVLALLFAGESFRWKALFGAVLVSIGAILMSI